MSATVDRYNASGSPATGPGTGCQPTQFTSIWIFAILPESIGIVGLGAIGGSVAWCAARAGVRRIVGYSRALSDSVEALKRGAITEAADTPERAVRGARLVVLAAPPAATRSLLGGLPAWLDTDAIATDVASIKTTIMEAATRAGLGRRFAGSHPLAGTHDTGFAAASPDLLRRAVVYVCSTGTVEGDDVARAVSRFWREAADAEPVLIDAANHDAQLAWTSHLPQAVASALAAALAGRQLGGVSFGRGARDTTRLAASDPRLWVEILLENAGPVQEALSATTRELERFQELLASRDAAGLLAYLERAATFRRGLER